MIVFDKRATQLDNLLNEMAKEVQLDETRYKRMIVSYEAVKNWIESDEIFFKPYEYEVYPHGSVRIFTTVKPIGKDEFDLDMVLHFKDTMIVHSPLKIYSELKRRLNEHDIYKKMVESKSRVIRLNYSGDFHMDLMSGIQDNPLDENKIRVPDRELGEWVSSNPRGYANWFMDKANLVKSSLLEKALRAERIQPDDFNNKKPLQRAVQLIKRYRDIYFEDDSTYKTRSIILTTIAGQLYSGEESIFETIDNVIMRVRAEFLLDQRLKIINPVNSDEDFTDKWDDEPKFYEAFKAFIEHLYIEWQKLKEENGLLDESRIFKGLFGEQLIENVQLRESQRIEARRKNGDLGILRNSGIIAGNINPNTESVSKNTFFGE
jgi:hypothetical protein